MANSGFDPTRRNRNIGTGKQGHGQDNRFVVPAVCHAERNWTEYLNPHQIIRRRIKGWAKTFIVEDNHGGCIHACSVDDICYAMAELPSWDHRRIEIIVLRQSSLKQRLLHPAWGRLIFSADLAPPGQKPFYSGPAIMLEAIDCRADFVWPASLTPSDRAEFDRLLADGHKVSREGRRYVLSPTPASVRATQLYRTLFHEIGHWVDFTQKVLRPSEQHQGDYSALAANYFSRPPQEREAFAHRYAETNREHLTRFGILPFDRIN